MIFAREVTDSLTSLVKKMEAATKANKSKDLCSFAVFLSDDEKLPEQLKQLAKKENLAECVLTVDHPAGPEAYKIAKDAEITVLMYKQHTVKVNRSFRKGELNDKAIDEVVASVKRILE